MITERINKRKEEKQALQTQLAIEMKKQIGFEYPQILAFLEYLRDLPDDNEIKRNGLINIFVNAIYLYDNHFMLILNAGTRQLEIDNIPLDDIEAAFGDGVPADETGSPIVSNVPPKRTPPQRGGVLLGGVEEELNQYKSNCPADSWGDQCKHWSPPYNFSPAEKNWQSTPLGSS